MIVSISGKKLAGKDTFAEFLPNFKRYAFADALKKGCAKAFFLPEELFHDQKLKEHPFIAPIVLDDYHLNKLADVFGFETHPHYYLTGRKVSLKTPRELLQFVGTDLIRKTIDDNFWIDKTVEALRKETENVLIADSRFLNERKLLKSLGAKLVLIKRNSTNSDSHSSENDLGNDSDYDYVIENNGTLEELKEKATKFRKDVVI